MGNLYETPLIMTYLKKERVNLSFGGFDCYVIEVKNANTKADYYFSNKGLILEKAISINKNDTIENEIKLIKIINGS